MINNIDYGINIGKSKGTSVGEGLAKIVANGLDSFGQVSKAQENRDEKQRILENRAEAEKIDSDALLFLEEKAGLEQNKIDNNFVSMNGSDRIDFIDNYYFESQFEYKTDKYKNHSNMYKNKELGFAQKIEQDDFVDLVKNEAIPTIASQRKNITMEEVDLYANSFSKNGIKNAKALLLGQISIGIENDLAENSQDIVSGRLTIDEMKELYPVYNEINDARFTKNVESKMNILHNKIERLNYDDSISSYVAKSSIGEADINKLYVDSNKRYGKTYADIRNDVKARAEGFVEVMISKDDEISRIQGIEVAKKNNIKIKAYDTHIKNIGNLSIISPKDALESYSKITQAVSDGYGFNNTDLSNYVELDYALTTGNADKKNLTENDFDVARNLLLNKKEFGFKSISSSEFVKKIDADYSGDFSVGQQQALFRKARAYSRFYPRDDAMAMAIKELELKPLLKYDDVEIDTEGTGLETKENIAEFLIYQNQDNVNADITDIKRTGDLITLLNSDGEPVTSAMTPKSIANYMTKRRDKNKEEAENLEITVRNKKKMEAESMMLFSSKNKIEKTPQEANIENASKIGMIGLSIKKNAKALTESLSETADSFIDRVLSFGRYSSESTTVLTNEEHKTVSKIIELEVKKNPSIMKKIDSHFKKSNEKEILDYINGLPVDEKIKIINKEK